MEQPAAGIEMAILIIDETAREEIRKAIERARLPINEAPDTVMLGSYRVAISFEAPLAGARERRLSISALEAGTLPSASAVRMIIEAFGFNKRGVTRTWLVETEPQHRSYNVAQTEET